MHQHANAPAYARMYVHTYVPVLARTLTLPTLCMYVRTPHPDSPHILNSVGPGGSDDMDKSAPGGQTTIRSLGARQPRRQRRLLLRLRRHGPRPSATTTYFGGLALAATTAECLCSPAPAPHTLTVSLAASAPIAPPSFRQGRSERGGRSEHDVPQPNSRPNRTLRLSTFLPHQQCAALLPLLLRHTTCVLLLGAGPPSLSRSEQ